MWKRIMYSWSPYLQRHNESTCWRGVAVQQKFPQRGRSILCYCKERSGRRTFITKNIKTAHSSYGGGYLYNRMHGNWGEKTLCDSEIYPKAAWKFLSPSRSTRCLSSVSL